MIEAELIPTPRIQFFISDYWILIAQLCIYVFPLSQTPSQTSNDIVIYPLILNFLLLSLWWYMGIKMLSKAGINPFFCRMAFLGLAVPFAFGGSFIGFLALSVLWSEPAVAALVFMVMFAVLCFARALASYTVSKQRTQP